MTAVWRPSPAWSGTGRGGEDLGQVQAPNPAELAGLGAAGEAVGQEDGAGRGARSAGSSAFSATATDTS